MSENKIVHELSVEDLVRLANSSKEEIVMDKVSEAAKFIYHQNIRIGDTKISAQLLYHTYKHWKGWRNRKQPKHLFFRDFNKYFEPKRDKNGNYYTLDETGFDLSKQNYWIMRKELRDEKHNGQKTKKKPIKKSEPDTGV